MIACELLTGRRPFNPDAPTQIAAMQQLIGMQRAEQIVPLRRTKPVNVHVFGNQTVETKVYLMLPTEADEVKVDGCGVFEGMLTRAEDEARTGESWIDTQVEESDKSNEF